MLTLPTSPELERLLETEAAKRGLPASEYALRLIEGLLHSNRTSDTAEQTHFAAIDELLGAAADTSFSSATLLQERDDERRHEQNIQTTGQQK